MELLFLIILHIPIFLMAYDPPPWKTGTHQKYRYTKDEDSEEEND
jgi:hypothetical protein